MGGGRSYSGTTLNGLLLIGVLLLMMLIGGIAVTLYLLPTDSLRLPELQPFARVGDDAGFPVGASRTVTWGDAIILVVRSGEMEFAALEGVSPSDGCLLEWDAEAFRVVSPCTYTVHDLRGDVVEGLTRLPLRKYAVYVRDGVVYVTT
jgi:nitrite reductase/ring-hydroxylating ferredoxin subunit